MFSLKKKNEKPLDDYLKDWPIQFYQLSDVPLRDKCIRRYLDIHPDSTIDQRRYDIFLQRFGVKEQKVDGYFYNWNLLKAESESSSFLNKKHRQNNLRKYFIGLGVLSTTMDDLQKEEWKNFAEMFVETSINGASYGSTLMGLGKVSDHNKAVRIANDIYTVTCLLPREVYLEKEASVLRTIMEDTFKAKIEGGDEILSHIH
jgi:hypothetical protein